MSRIPNTVFPSNTVRYRRENFLPDFFFGGSARHWVPDRTIDFALHRRLTCVDPSSVKLFSVNLCGNSYDFEQFRIFEKGEILTFSCYVSGISLLGTTESVGTIDSALWTAKPSCAFFEDDKRVLYLHKCSNVLWWQLADYHLQFTVPATGTVYIFW